MWLRPEIDAATGLPLGVTPAAVADGFRRAPKAVAVLLGEPSYVGTVADVDGTADIAHARGVPLVIDAAWAAHFGFHPDLPPHALQQGADALVTSAHKAFPAWSQAALILARGERIDPSRALIARDGPRLFGALIERVAAARVRLSAVPGLVVLDGPRVDPVKLTVVLPATGVDGLAVERDLLAAGLPVEMADRDTIVAVVTPADDEARLDRLVDALVEGIERHRGGPRSVVPAAAWTVDPVAVVDPRTAFFAPHATVPAAEAIDRTCAELIAPYPPGIPVLAPGERITAEAVSALLEARDQGLRVAYAADPTLATLRVLA